VVTHGLESVAKKEECHCKESRSSQMERETIEAVKQFRASKDSGIKLEAFY
jgi:hypothetical protein